MQEVQKTDQVAFRVFSKLTHVVNATRATSAPVTEPRLDRWFNLVTPCSDLLVGDSCREYLELSSFQPAPLEVQVLLSVPELPTNKTLRYHSSPNDPRFEAYFPERKYILLESHVLTFTPNEHTASSVVPPSTMYKQGIILFRSLFSLLHTLPSWSLHKRLKRLRGRNGNLNIVVRLKEPSNRDQVLGFGEALSPSQSMQPNILPTETCSLGSIPHTRGALTLTITYLSSAHFSIIEKENLLSAMFLETSPEPSEFFIGSASTKRATPIHIQFDERSSGKDDAAMSPGTAGTTPISSPISTNDSTPGTSSQRSCRHLLLRASRSPSRSSTTKTSSSDLNSFNTAIERLRNFPAPLDNSTPTVTLDVAHGQSVGPHARSSSFHVPGPDADALRARPIVKSLSFPSIPPASMSRASPGLTPFINQAINYLRNYSPAQGRHPARHTLDRSDVLPTASSEFAVDIEEEEPDTIDCSNCLVFRESLNFLQSVISQVQDSSSEQARTWRICHDLAAQDNIVAAISNCRTILIHIEKIVLHAQVLPGLFQDVIRQDWIVITQHLSAIFTDQTQVLQLHDLDAKQFLDSLQTVLDKMPLLGLPNSSTFDTKARKLIVKLSKKTRSLPADLFIQDVLRPYGDAVSGGSFGDIYRTRYHGMDVALKRIRIFQRDLDHRNTWEKLCREAIVWRKLDHPNVLPFLGIDMDSFPSFCCLVSPWMGHGTIRKYLDDFGPSRLFLQLEEIARGLEYLHSQGIVHGDLRGSNILVNDHHRTLLADFGLAVFSDATAATRSVTQGGSVRWMAPELLLPEHFGFESFCRTPASDIYSYACVIYELYTRSVPWRSIMHDATVIYKVVNGDRLDQSSCCVRSTDAAMPDSLWNIVEQCWKHSASERLNATEVIHLIKSISM